MLPDIWSNASAMEPEFSNCGLGKFVASEMKHRKMVNGDMEKLQQTLYSEELITKNTSQFTLDFQSLSGRHPVLNF